MRARLPRHDPRPPSRGEIEHAREVARIHAEGRAERARAHSEQAAQLDARERQRAEAEERATFMREQEEPIVRGWLSGGGD